MGKITRRYHSMALPKRVEQLGGEELGSAELPCGLRVDLSRGECCKHSCPDPDKRNRSTRDPNNPIERCYHGLKAARPAGQISAAS